MALGARQASGPPLAARLSPRLALFLRQLRPFHQGCSSKCTKARDGCKRRRELSWRQLEQRAGRHDSRASASAPTAAADGRKVVGGGRGTSCGTCEAVRAPQGRNLTALRPAGGAGSRKNLLRTMPWYPCSSINTAIREISPSAGDWHIALYSGHYIRCATAKGPGCVEYSWEDPNNMPLYLRAPNHVKSRTPKLTV